MTPAALNFLKRLLDTPSPSGFEKPIQDVVRDYVKDFADTVERNTLLEKLVD